MVTIFAIPNGVVVQLVRIHACHAWGRGFESRPFRFKQCQKQLKACKSNDYRLFCLPQSAKICINSHQNGEQFGEHFPG
jgi:hypothetical protein